ncbi:MAG: ABC transporter permease [Ktedonobacteraceae bacterium]|nr:ABC transporter permease [Ktedonobacteraceae bacterium]
MQQTGPVQGAAADAEIALSQDLRELKPGGARSTRRRGFALFAGQGSKWSKLIFYLVVGFFVLNLVGMVGSVILDSFGHEWFATWFPSSYSTEWYSYLTTDEGHDIGQLLFNTFFVALAATLFALIVGFPAAYVLARKQFRFKSALTALYLLPMLIPSLAYGIPLATLLLRVGLGDLIGSSLVNVVIINMVPILPFVILILTPFIEQVDVSLERASQMLGANRLQTFVRVVLPLVIPGILTAGVLAMVRAIAMFELTYLVADASSGTLVVALYGDAFGAGIRPNQAIDALAVIYMLTTMALLVVALIFVKPTQFVVRLKGR